MTWEEKIFAQTEQIKVEMAAIREILSALIGKSAGGDVEKPTPLPDSYAQRVLETLEHRAKLDAKRRRA